MNGVAHVPRFSLTTRRQRRASTAVAESPVNGAGNLESSVMMLKSQHCSLYSAEGASACEPPSRTIAQRNQALAYTPLRLTVRGDSPSSLAVCSTVIWAK